MKWADVTLTRRSGTVLRGEQAKTWIETKFKGLIVDRDNGIVLMKVGGGTLFQDTQLRDELIKRAEGEVTDFTGPPPKVEPASLPKPVRPSLENSIKTPLPRLAMHLDEDRDGRIDDDPANSPTWVWGRRPEGRGAIVMVPLRDCAPDAEVVERMELQLRWTGPYVDGWTATLSVDKPEQIRVFAQGGGRTGRQLGAIEVLGQKETGVSYVIDAAPSFGGIVFDQSADSVPPELAQESARKTIAALNGASSPDEQTFRTTYRKKFLEQIKVDYRQAQIAGFERTVDDNRAVLEPLAGKSLTFGVVRPVKTALTKQGALAKNVADSLTSQTMASKTFATFDDLKQASVEACTAGIQLPSDETFVGRFDELCTVLVPAARRPIFAKKASFDLAAGVSVFDGIAGSKEPMRTASLWIEAVEIPDAPEDAAWEVMLTFRFTPPKGRGDAIEQRAVLRIAPWLMSSDLEPTAELFAKNVGGALMPMAQTLSDFAGAAKSGFVPVAAKTTTEKGFLRDLIKSGHVAAPHARSRVVMTGLDPRTYLIVDQQVKTGRDKADVALLRRPVAATKATSQDNGGNYMVSPPTKAHPFGRIIYGHVDPLVCNHGPFLDAQRVQAPIRVDAVWLSVGHSDEMLSFLPDRSKAPREDWPYKLLFANSRLALLMLLETAAQVGPALASVTELITRAVKMHDDHRYATIDDAFIKTHYPSLQNVVAADVVPAVGFVPGGLPPADSDGQVVLRDAPESGPHGTFTRLGAQAYLVAHADELQSFAKNVQPRIDAVRKQLVTELGLKEEDVLDVPVLFHGMVPITADCVNMLVLETETATRCLVPKPFGPVIAGEYVYERYLHDRLTALGVTFTFHDDWFDFHVHEGEIHCGTNQLPVPLADHRWWEMDAPGAVKHAPQNALPVVVVPRVPNPAEEVVGIQNVGNTCYLASTLQVLVHSTFAPDANAIALAPLSNMVSRYRADAANGSYVLQSDVVRTTTASASVLRDDLVQQGLVTRGREEDPCPVWEYLLDALGERFSLRVRKRYTLQNQQGRAPTDGDVVLTSQGWQSQPEVQVHNIVRIEPGVVGTLSEAWEAAWNRTTGEMGTLNNARVNQLVYAQLPQVEETTAWEGAMPRRFVVQLKRFSYGVDARKITRSVAVDATLRTGGHDHVLRGVILHQGDTPTTGHYVAYVKARRSQNWFEVSDARVELRSEAYVLDKAKTSYMFYFERA